MLVDRFRPRLILLIPIAMATVHLVSFADAQPPAGQRCPAGAFVTGFDNEGNILCGEPIRDGGPAPGEAPAGRPPEAGHTGPDAHSAAAGAETAETAPAPVTGNTSVTAPVITKVTPWSVVYGKRELAVVITGSGFTANSTVVFNGRNHAATVNSDGTELSVTLNTAGLALGQYPISIVNGPGQAARLRRGVVVY